MKTQDAMTLALLGIGGYFLYRFYGTAQKATEPAANVIANFYTWLTLPGTMTPLGNMTLPDSTQVPIASVDVRQAPSGNTIAEYAGHYYQLSPSDANGNWPAVLIQ